MGVGQRLREDLAARRELRVQFAANPAPAIYLWSRTAVWLAVIFLAVFPMALFLQAVYSESLYLLLVLAAFALAERGRFATAGLVTGLAILTRASGVALLPALAVLAWRNRDRTRAAASLALAV